MTVTIKLTAETDEQLEELLQALSFRIRLHGSENVTKVMDENGNSVGTVDVTN